MSGSENLRKAKERKNDEFYTRLSDIEIELQNYKEQFKDKIVFCNCDDPYESDFFKYFAINFNQLGLKKLITTCYAGSPIITEQLSLLDIKGLEIKKDYEKNPYKIEITEVSDLNGDGAINLSDVEYLIKNKKNTLSLLKSDGDFRSKECIELLKESDIVVTNPPFSLFREYIELLMNYNKQFLIIGNKNAAAYKEVFPLIKNNRVWFGYSVPKDFRLPNGEITKKQNGLCRWFTNLEVKRRSEFIILYKDYSPEVYKKYDNYDAIDVGSVSDIPRNYYGKMGVPITFLDSFNPKQFRIIGMGTGDTAKQIGITKNYRGRTDLALTVNGVHKCPYNRIIIQMINKNGDEYGSK